MKNIHQELLNYVTLHKDRIPHFHKDFPLILFWSHRSGCTTLANWFFFQIGLFPEAKKYNDFIHYYEFWVYKNNPNYIQALHSGLLESKKHVCKLVRNPYTRAVSSFLLLADNPYASPQWDSIRKCFYNDKHSKQGISFKQFLYYVQALGSNSQVIDMHFSQQYVQGEEAFIQRYIPLEDFNKQIPKIENEYGLIKSDLTKLTSSGHHRAHKMVYTGSYAELSITDEAFPQFPTYASFYDKETMDLVTEIYAKDFEMYPYTKGIF
ncbi:MULTISPECIES: sulfotransferase family 2 domain-containing protein [Bacillus]|uniref:RNA methyltransferase n=2 Tax=Bacillus cereus group TaxID=86661 RepID=A0A2B0WHQ7_BACAN|nr:MULTISPECIES: sulfotransferase family 2 domain-containing protein [Bacillus]KZD39647.1 Beta-galactosidase [Bacillus cereus]MBJ8062252.1 sulfotransferase family 2 domain-containing protein [Bacillus cereus]MCU4760329.1 sulfotransferase family protein [Bacillus cereus]MCU5109876.1 sulfotransferase family protein [Bacillus cereus]MCU5343248.1 sulfotransferase family protein [Bacillus cereus]